MADLPSLPVLPGGPESAAAPKRLPMVTDCDARHPLCGAHCCTLEIRLTDEEIASGRYRRAAHRPHYLERVEEGEGAGHCVYWRGQHDANACSIHADRPAACRAYTCFGDRRFWRDFEARVPNPKAIGALKSRGLSPPRDD